jgi:DNA-binding MarR family transcriptional regulator
MVRITESGRQLLERMWPVYADAIRRHLADRITEDEAAVLARILGKL